MVATIPTTPTYKPLPGERLLRRLEPPAGLVHAVLDTDTYNEIDDQFALAYALLSPEHIHLEAVYAAPFHNRRSSGPEDGMRRSYEEIVRVLALFGRSPDGIAYQGSRAWLSAPDMPVPSPAAEDLIRRARAEREHPLYVVAIGAITNVASALLLAPEIAGQIVVVWLGGNHHTWHRASEFNLSQDMQAARVIFDCGVPLVQVPCKNVAEHVRTTLPEVERYVKGRGPIGDFLHETYAGWYQDHFGRSKVLWDLAAVAWLINPAWVETALVHSPILTSEGTWGYGPQRHFIREAYAVQRDPIFQDLFRKLDGLSGANVE
jgi:purine nucleosidase